MPVYVESLGDRVREILADKGYSVREVERRAAGAISHQTVRNLVNNAAVSSDYIVAFAEAIGDTPEERAEIADDLLRRANRPLRYVPVNTTPKRPRVRLPVSSASGGVLPGVDLNNTASLLDLLESEKPQA